MIDTNKIKNRLFLYKSEDGNKAKNRLLFKISRNVYAVIKEDCSFSISGLPDDNKSYEVDETNLDKFSPILERVRTMMRLRLLIFHVLTRDSFSNVEKGMIKCVKGNETISFFCMRRVYLQVEVSWFHYKIVD